MVAEHKVPNRFVGCPTFGGPNRETLYVNSGAVAIHFYIPSIDAPLRGPPYGNLYMLSGLGEKGVQSYKPCV